MKWNNNVSQRLNALLVLLLITFSGLTQNQDYFTTSGNKIKDPCGNNFIPRGVNYSLADDWNFPGNLNNGKELSSQISLANPNTVRIQWYVDYGQSSRPALTLVGLDSVISRFAAANIASILEIHDFTHIHTDTTLFNSQVVAWWTSQPILDLIEKHQSHIFVNVANEYGPSLYPPPTYTTNPNYAAEITTWVKHYKNVIVRLRNAGIKVPIVIDAPNYGMDYQTVVSNATVFNNHDPLNRIIMSCHTYWGTDAAGMAAIVNQLSALTVPVIFGEVGNVDFSCNAIPMNSFLEACQDKDMGWLAWTWNRDECDDRNMTDNQPGVPSSTTDGMFSTLTAYGQTIVNNAIFGLANHAVKADFSCLLGLETIENKIEIYPNPVNDILHILVNQPYQQLQITVFDMNGKEILSEELSAGNTAINTESLEKGVYILQVEVDNQPIVLRILK
ncbi:MAG: cellulase family glycosylhydrolase [Crocinitomicaceae bacterium]|nr:cellulase family glycosylhydrolase [Crocinitomicaceae bacterium]